MVPALRAALGFWVSSCCCVEPGRTGSAPLRPQRLPICAPGPGPPRPSVRLSASCPTPEPAGGGGPSGVGEGLRHHMTPRQGQPAACCPRGPWLTAEPLFRPKAPGSGHGWPGQGAPLSCRAAWSFPPGSQAPCGPPGGSSPCFWQAGPARDLQTSASPLGAQDVGSQLGQMWLESPGDGQALPAGWLCRRQTQTPEEMEGGQALGGVWQSWRAPGAHLHPHPCSEGLLQTGRVCEVGAGGVGICFRFSASGGGRAGPPHAWAVWGVWAWGDFQEVAGAVPGGGAQG